ncbi:MAG: dienelactone hydrolase family protein [Trueperaceae bacterium]
MLDELNALLDTVLQQHTVNPKRVYLTRLSMGAQGLWYWAARNPERFAALVAVCGRGFPERAVAIAHLPVWVFYGSSDTTTPITYSKSMVEALEHAAGGQPRFTVYRGLDHDCWTPTFASAELYT